MEEHIVVCPARPVRCSDCNLEMPQGMREQHEEACEEVVVSCLLARFGCAWEGRRGYLKNTHTPQCPLAPLESYLLKQEQALNGLRQENYRVVKELDLMKQEQEKASLLIQRCISSLGSTYVDSDSIHRYPSVSSNRDGENSSHLVVPIPSPHHLGRPPSSPPLTLQGRSGTTLDIPAAVGSRLDGTEDMHLASTSAPASRADFPWQWPDPSHTSTPLSLPPSKTVSDALTELNDKVNNIYEQLNQIDRRMEDSHVVGLNANFEASRAHEELNSVRHGLHALRISLLMQQQRSMPGQPSPDNRPGENAMPFAAGLGPSMMGLRRFWTGFEQTKL